MTLFPKPRDLEMLDGILNVPAGDAGEDLVSFFRRLKEGLSWVRLVPSPLSGKEEYLLRVDGSGVEIGYSCEESLFRAVTSLRQMLLRTGGCLPQVRIHDKPDLARRGYMLDISRGKKPTVATLRGMIDFLAALKYNEFQLYMEGDCFKYAAYPAETADYDCLTPEDVRELDRYCRERFIDLVPNQNSFGHMYTWLKKPAFHHLGLYGTEDEVPSTLNPLLPESFEFMKNLYASLLPCFSSEYVNIGLDEAYGLGRYQIEEVCREKGKDIVFMEWLNKLSSHIRETYGKTVMFWADMIYNYPESYHLVPKGAVALEWGYELIQSQRMASHCIDYQKAGVRYYVCPSVNTHASLAGRMDVTTFNIRTCAEIALEYGAEGILLTDWGDGGHPQSWIWSMNPIALCGQYAWNSGVPQDGETFKADFIRDAESFVDDCAFGGVRLSRLLYRMANYYLLEPERIHCSTWCARELMMPIQETKYAYLFDLKDCGDDFYFDNVTEYVRRVMADIEKLDFDETWKREIRMTAQLIEIGSEICKVKLHPEASASAAQELANRLIRLLPEYRALWLLRNYEKGIERSYNHFVNRARELRALAEADPPLLG